VENAWNRLTIRRNSAYKTKSTELHLRPADVWGHSTDSECPRLVQSISTVVVADRKWCSRAVPDVDVFCRLIATVQGLLNRFSPHRPTRRQLHTLSSWKTLAINYPCNEQSEISYHSQLWISLITSLTLKIL